jgi:hypothetical protein
LRGELRDSALAPGQRFEPANPRAPRPGARDQQLGSYSVGDHTSAAAVGEVKRLAQRLLCLAALTRTSKRCARRLERSIVSPSCRLRKPRRCARR